MTGRYLLSRSRDVFSERAGRLRAALLCVLWTSPPYSEKNIRHPPSEYYLCRLFQAFFPEATVPNSHGLGAPRISWQAANLLSIRSANDAARGRRA